MVGFVELPIALVRFGLKQLSTWFFTDYLTMMLVTSFQWALCYGLFMSVVLKAIGATVKREQLVREGIAVWLSLAFVSEPGRFVLFYLAWEVIGSGNMAQYVR